MGQQHVVGGAQEFRHAQLQARRMDIVQVPLPYEALGLIDGQPVGDPV